MLNNGILGLIALIIGIYFIIHGFNSLKKFFQTINLIRWKFFPYKKDFISPAKEKCPYIFILVPVFKEQRIIVSFLKNLSCLDYPISKYKVIIITTEKEHYSGRKDYNKTTIEIINDYLQADNPGNFLKIHYPFIRGHKTDQLNYALNILKKKYPSSFLGGVFFCVFDADSIIHRNILKIFVNSLEKHPRFSIFQQPNLWLKNFNNLPRSFNGYLIKAFALSHTYYAISYEIPMLAREYDKFPYRMKYCMGHGLFIKGSILEKLRGFPSLIEDTRLGHLCSFLKINITALPILGIVETAKNFQSLIKQISVWFTGESLIIRDFLIARSIKKELNLPYAFFLLFHKALKNFGWMNEGLLFLLGLGIGVFLKNPLIISLYFLVLLINVWLPTFILLNRANWFLEPYNLSIPSFTFMQKMILFIASTINFCFVFLGPYLGALRLLKVLLTKKPLILPKTDR